MSLTGGEPSDAGDRQRHLIDGEYADSGDQRVVLCVDSLDPEVGGDALQVASGFGLALVDLGWAVSVVPRDGWHTVTSTDVFVALLAEVDPSSAPDDAWSVAWVIGDVDAWLGSGRLVGYDQVLAASRLTLDRLQRKTPGAAGVLPLAAELATPRAPLPSFEVVDSATAGTGSGIVPLGFYAAAVRGRLPVVHGELGLRELGIEGVPTYADQDDLSGVLDQLGRDSDVTERAETLERLVRRDHSWHTRARDWCELVVGARADGPTPARRALHFFPDYIGENPYQAMLYAGLAEVGAYPVSVPDVIEHLRRRVERSGHPGTLNLHWTGPILRGTRGIYSAASALMAFIDALDAFRARGGQLVWTVHNVLPHEVRHQWAELALARHLAASADVVHVMSTATLVETAPFYELEPERTVVVEHASYLGLYPDWVTPQAARARLGIHPEEKVLLTLGTIRPYKGLDGLLEAFEDLTALDPTLRLLVAGVPMPSPATDELCERLRAHPRVITCFEKIPDDQLQVWMRAADLAVLPYRKVLNSGAYLLALTFGLPVVAPRDGALRAEAGQPHVRLFEPDLPTSLASVLRAAVEDMVLDPLEAPVAVTSAKEAAERRRPEAMASAFAAALESTLTYNLGRG
ncbi:MAG: glycosyltransferase family 4 protein [Nocardioides sp.]